MTDSPAVNPSIEVRREDHDIDEFAARIADLVMGTEPVVAQIHQSDDDMNRITLTVHTAEERP
ncbi:MAG: hypothetical protein ACRDSE_04280 [Pseudonocardiaceae bacterium]